MFSDVSLNRFHFKIFILGIRVLADLGVSSNFDANFTFARCTSPEFKHLCSQCFTIWYRSNFQKMSDLFFPTGHKLRPKKFASKNVWFCEQTWNPASWRLRGFLEAGHLWSPEVALPESRQRWLVHWSRAWAVSSRRAPAQGSRESSAQIFCRKVHQIGSLLKWTEMFLKSCPCSCKI